jgi:hypothetical protein
MMKSAKLYRQYAADCRRMAGSMPPEQQEKLLEIAKAWDMCAEEAEHGRTNDDDDDPADAATCTVEPKDDGLWAGAFVSQCRATVSYRVAIA